MGVKNEKGNEAKVVYDPFQGVLSREVISEDQKDNYERVRVEGRSKRVEIYLDEKDSPLKTKTLLARVDIGQLGISELFQRYRGNTQEIWVKGAGSLK